MCVAACVRARVGEVCMRACACVGMREGYEGRFVVEEVGVKELVQRDWDEKKSVGHHNEPV